MRKTFVFIVLILLIISKLKAQDLIVTSEGDSINCTITKTTNEYIYFTFKHNSEIRSTLIPIDQIVSQQKNYFFKPEIPINYVFKTKFPRFRAALDGGWQYRLAKFESGMDHFWQSHYKKMKSGFHYDIQAACFFLENQGVEAMFSRQFFSNELKDVILFDETGAPIAFGILKEKITFNYAGANYIVRFFDSRKKNCFLITVGLGYLGYVDNVIFNDDEFAKMTAATLGFNFGLGYDLAIAENFGIGFKASFMGGTFSNYELTMDGITTNETMPEKTSEGLGTIKLSVGLRFNK